MEFDPPIRQRRSDNELCESFVVDRLDFRGNECTRFRDLCHQILDLPDPREVFIVRAVLGQLKGCEVIKALKFHLERLFKFKTINKALGRGAELAPPFFQPRIRCLDPNKSFLPLPHVSKKTRQVPFIRLGNFGACWYF